MRRPVINNGGGHANHTMFWEIMGPDGGGEPSGDLADAIDAAFGGFAEFKEKRQRSRRQALRQRLGVAGLDTAASSRSLSTANQDSPLMEGDMPMLGIDVWEHAYYLKYQNKRPAYLEAGGTWSTGTRWRGVRRGARVVGLARPALLRRYRVTTMIWRLSCWT